MVRLVSEHSSCAVMATLATAHSSVMTLCLWEQTGSFLFPLPNQRVQPSYLQLTPLHCCRHCPAMFSLKLKQTNDKIIMFVCLQIKVVSDEQE